ncbi:MAG: hypothetical protein Q9167_000802 [Letrouitia subvulpina]
MYCCQEDGNATACCGNKEFVGISPVHFMKQIPLNTTNNNTSFGQLFPDPVSVDPAMVTSTSTPSSKSTPLPAAKPSSNSIQPSQSPQSSQSSNSSLGRSLGLGLGLGIPLGLILSGFIFWCLRGRRGFRDSPNPEKMHHKHVQKAKRQAVEMSGSHFWQPPKEMDVPAPRYSIQKPFGFPERFVGNTRGDSPPNALNRMASYHGEHRGSTGWG